MVFPLKCRGYYTVEQVLAAQEKGMSLQLPGGSNHCESAYNEMENKPILAKPKAKFVFGKNRKNKHERDFVLQVRCRDLNNSC